MYGLQLLVLPRRVYFIFLSRRFLVRGNGASSVWVWLLWFAMSVFEPCSFTLELALHQGIISSLQPLTTSDLIFPSKLVHL